MVLVGATTQNPFFALTSALVSRSRMFQFEPLSADDIKRLLRRAMADKERGFGQLRRRGPTTTRSTFWPKSATATPAGRSARWKSASCRASERPLHFTRELAAESVQRKAIEYDRDGDAHYDCGQRADQEHSRQRSRRGASIGWRGCSKRAKKCAFWLAGW